MLKLNLQHLLILSYIRDHPGTSTADLSMLPGLMQYYRGLKRSRNNDLMRLSNLCLTLTKDQLLVKSEKNADDKHFFIYSLSQSGLKQLNEIAQWLNLTLTSSSIPKDPKEPKESKNAPRVKDDSNLSRLEISQQTLDLVVIHLITAHKKELTALLQTLNIDKALTDAQKQNIRLVGSTMASDLKISIKNQKA